MLSANKDHKNTGKLDPAEDTEQSQSHQVAQKQQSPEVVPGRDGFGVLVVQTVEVIAWVAFRGSFIEVTVPFDMDSYHTTLETRNRVNARVVYGWAEVTGQPFMRVRQVGWRSACWTGLTTLYTHINLCPWGSFQLFLLMF